MPPGSLFLCKKRCPPVASAFFPLTLFYLDRMKRFALLLAACLAFVGLKAQNSIINSLQRDVPGQGKVTIHQDARITALIGSEYVPTGADDERVLKVPGYRVQVYAGNNTRRARTEAQTVGDSIQSLFPELPVYTNFIPPRWLCRVGDYRSIEEADALMRQLRATGRFKEVSIVRDQINIPLY